MGLSVSCSFLRWNIFQFIDAHFLLYKSFSATEAVYSMKTEVLSVMDTILCHNIVFRTENGLKNFLDIGIIG